MTSNILYISYICISIQWFHIILNKTLYIISIPLRLNIYHSILNEQTHNFPPVGPTFSDAATMESSEDLELLHAENAPREIPRSRSLKLSIALVPWHRPSPCRKWVISPKKQWSYTTICQKEGKLYCIYRFIIEVTWKSPWSFEFPRTVKLFLCLERKVGLVVLACASFFALALHWSYRSSRTFVRLFKWNMYKEAIAL